MEGRGDPSSELLDAKASHLPAPRLSALQGAESTNSSMLTIPYNVNRFVVKKPHSYTDVDAMRVQTTNGVEARGREPVTGHSIEEAQAGKSKVHTK